MIRSCAWVALWVSTAACQTWEFRAEGGRMHVFEHGRPVLEYCYGDQLAPGVDPSRTRSSYFHPIYGLDGEVLTEDFPKDHEHHRGLSLMWPVMTVGGERCDLWTIENIRSELQSIQAPFARDGVAILGFANVWRMPKRGEVAAEKIDVEIQPADAKGRVIDVRYTLTATQDPITLRGQTTKQKGYGGLVLRTLHSSRRKAGTITTDTGVMEKDSLRVPFRWADFTVAHPEREAMSGMSVIPAADHPGHPTTWMLRHYGVLNPSWPGNAEFVMQPGVPLVLRYRIYVHRGAITADRIEQLSEF